MPNPLFEFAYIPDYDDRLAELAGKAQNEDWEYRHTNSIRRFPILSSYLSHTFMRLQEESKVAELSDKACFNTGLVTENQEEVFAYFVLNHNQGKQRWFLQAFCHESDRRLDPFGKLPEMAHYFDHPSDLLYDSNLQLRPNLDHIVDDNRARFPEPLKSMPEKHQLLITLKGAVEHALKRVKRNYKTAIPQYYRTGGSPGQLQLLLPLCLTSESAADLALAVYRSGGAYLAATCLTLDMAYNNARLIARPDTEWLIP